MSKRGKRVRSLLIAILVLALIGGAATGIYRLTRVEASATFPVAPARKGDFSVIVRSRGELHAGRSIQVYAPIVPGLRI